MSIVINPEKLCEYCRDINDQPNSWHCEAGYCDDAREKYLEDMGINPDPVKTFKDLLISDSIHILKDDKIPSIETWKIKELRNTIENKLKICTDRHAYFINNTDLNNTRHDDMYLNKKDAEKELEKRCISRIVELSKVLGSVK